MPLEQTRPDGHGRARGLVSSRKSGARVDSQTFAPSPRLAELVERYWSTRWALAGQASHVAEVLTDPSVQLVFEQRLSRVVGVNTRLFRRELAGDGLIRAVKLKPGAAAAVLDVASVASLTDRTVPLAEFFEGIGALEREVLRGDDERGFATLERWLSARVRPPSAQVRLAVGVVERIQRVREVTTVSQVSRIAGLSTRPLQRLFRDFVGVSPKWVIRRERLREAAVELERGTNSLAELAVSLGYADHAHLTRDFKRATGRAPSVFARDVWK